MFLFYHKRKTMLNIFFDNMNSTLELILIGAFIFAVYWFVLRKYNSLGLRMLFLCVLLFAGCCTWLYKDEKNLSDLLAKGVVVQATVLLKSQTKNKDNVVQLSYTSDGKKITATTSEYVSQQEWDNMQEGHTVAAIEIPGTQQVFIQQSVMRFKGDKIYLYYFSGFWLVLGIGLYVWLRNYKVGVDENTGNEWLITKDGKIILDERTSEAARIAKRGNIISKIFQTFGK